MTFLLDVNVVVAGFRDDHPRHAPVRLWLETLWSADRPFTVPVTVWASFLRIVTHRRIFLSPSSLDSAFGFLEAVCAQPGYLQLAPGSRHLPLLREVSTRHEATGDLVPDAVIATIAAENGCVVATLDRDFARFSTITHQLLG